MHRHMLSACSLAAFIVVSNAQSATTIPPPGQPLRTGVPGSFEIIGESYVSAQQLFLGTEDKVYFVDKVEANPTPIGNHPAWASEWALASNMQRPMDVLTNSFCAGGNVLGNGTWLNVGGNQAVVWGGEPAQAQDGSAEPYFNADGRTSIRMLDPCDDGNCEWYLSPLPSQQRWYPTLETLQDGSVLILGGCLNGGYVNDRNQDNPTYQFFPPRDDGTPIQSPILASTLPANLYPLTWLLPSGKLLIQSNWATVTLDVATNTETPLDNIPEAVRVYPASAGTVMLPLTPVNNYTATILFCGGSWYNDRRPEPQGLLRSYSYGGPSFDVTLDAEDLFGDAENIKSAFVSIIRPGFSTHNMNMGQRSVQLDSTYTAYADNHTAVLHVSQLPPNPSILAPGPALIFVTVNGVPSVGKMIMVGNGVIGEQPIAQASALLASQVVAKTAEGKIGSGNNSAAGRVGVTEWWVVGLMMITSVFALGS